MDGLFEYLTRRGLTPKNVVARMGRWAPRTVIKDVTDVEEIVSESWSPTQSPFSFVANSQLSGGVHPCSSPECRLKQVELHQLYGSPSSLETHIRARTAVGEDRK